MAKIKLSLPLREAGQDSLERFWAHTGLGDSAVTARFFQLFAGRGDGGGASESAQATAGAADRIAVLRAPELAAIAIPASGGAGFVVSSSPLLGDALTQTERSALEGDRQAPIASVQLGAAPILGLSAAVDNSSSVAANYAVSISENLEPIGVYDARTKELMPGGVGNYEQLGAGADDQLVLSGDFSGGFALGQVVRGLDTIVLLGGNDYNFTATDELVGRGQTLTISAMPLAAGDHFLFDGSGETDGRFVFFGSRGSDAFIGGAGDDRIYGNEGADILAGGGGRDTFGFSFASDSSGRDYDTIGDFDIALDRIALGPNQSVTGFIDPIEAGTLSLDSFDADLGALLGGLGANQAAWVAPTSGDLAGTIFLVVDGNGEAGYQSGEDYVIAIGGAPLEDLSGQTGFFI